MKFHTIGKNLSYTEDVRSTSNPSLRLDSLLEEQKAKREDKLSSSHLSTFLVKFKMKKNQAVACQRRGKFSTTVGDDQDAVYWVKLSRAQDQGVHKIECDNCTRSSACRLHLQGNFSKRRSNIIRKTLNTSPAPRVTLRNRWQSPQQSSCSSRNNYHLRALQPALG